MSVILKKLTPFLLALTCQLTNISAPLASAEGGGAMDGGGGSDFGLEFKVTAMEAIRELYADKKSYPGLDLDRLAEIASGAKVAVVATPLKVKLDSVIQESTAVNYKSENRIEVNEARWQEITSKRMRQAIALHEVLSLGGLESTGVYPVSAKFLEKEGYTCTKGSFLELCALSFPIEPGTYGTISQRWCGILVSFGTNGDIEVEVTHNYAYSPPIGCGQAGALALYKKSKSKENLWTMQQKGSREIFTIEAKSPRSFVLTQKRRGEVIDEVKFFRISRTR